MALQTGKMLDESSTPKAPPVSSVSNVDGTLTVSPTTGAVVASLNLAHSNAWTGKQIFTALQLTTSPVVGYVLTSDASGNASWSPVPAGEWTAGAVSSLGVGLSIVGTTLTVTFPTPPVSSVSNSDGTLTISPTTGAVVASLNLGHTNTWTAVQTFGNNISLGGAQLNVSGLSSGQILEYNGTYWVNVAAPSGAVTSVSNSDGTLTVSPTTGAVVASLNLGHTNSWTAVQTFGNNISFGGAQLNISSLSAGQVLLYNGTYWINAFSQFLSDTKDTLLTSTAPTNVLSYTTSADVNYIVGVYFRVVTADTVVTVTVSWTDNSGAESYTLANATFVVGSYGMTPLYVNVAASNAITVTVTAGTANQVYVSASLDAGGGAGGASGGAVSSVSNADGTLTISPTTGAVNASLNLGHANSWSALQTFGNNITFGGAQLNVSALASNNILRYNGIYWINTTDVISIAAGTGISVNVATGAVTVTNTGIISLSAGGGISISGTNPATITNTGATSVSNSDGTLTISPTTGAVVASLNLSHANSWSGVQTFGNNISIGGYGAFSIASPAKGDLWYYDGTNMKNLAIGSTSNVLTVVGGVPAWQAGGGAASGTVIGINLDETIGTAVTSTSETTSKSYSLASNSYTLIVAEAECGVWNYGSSSQVTLKLYIGSTVRSIIIYLPQGMSGSDANHPLEMEPLKLSASLPAGGTIKLTVIGGGANTGGVAYSLRVYGVV